MLKLKFITGQLKKTFQLTKRYNKLIGSVGTNIEYQILTSEEEEILNIFAKTSSYSPAQILQMYLKTKRSYDKVRWLIRKSSALHQSWEYFYNQNEEICK